MVSLTFMAAPEITFDVIRDAVGAWLDIDGRLLDEKGLVIGRAISVLDDGYAVVVTAEVDDPSAIAGLSLGIGDRLRVSVEDGGTVVPGDD